MFDIVNCQIIYQQNIILEVQMQTNRKKNS